MSTKQRPKFSISARKKDAGKEAERLNLLAVWPGNGKIAGQSGVTIDGESLRAVLANPADYWIDFWDNTEGGSSSSKGMSKDEIKSRLDMPF